MLLVSVSSRKMWLLSTTTHQVALLCPMTRLLPIPFGPSMCPLWHFRPQSLWLHNFRFQMPLPAHYSQLKANCLISKAGKPICSCSMYVGTANCQGLGSMAHIPVPSVATPGMLPPHAPKFTFPKVLYIHMTPYIAANWKTTLTSEYAWINPWTS